MSASPAVGFAAAPSHGVPPAPPDAGARISRRACVALRRIARRETRRRPFAGGRSRPGRTPPPRSPSTESPPSTSSCRRGRRGTRPEDGAVAPRPAARSRRSRGSRVVERSEPFEENRADDGEPGSRGCGARAGALAEVRTRTHRPAPASRASPSEVRVLRRPGVRTPSQPGAKSKRKRYGVRYLSSPDASRTPSERTAQTTTPSASPIVTAAKARSRAPRARRAARSRARGRATSRRVQGAVPAPCGSRPPRASSGGRGQEAPELRRERLDVRGSTPRLRISSSTRRYGRAMRPAASAKAPMPMTVAAMTRRSGTGTARSASAKTAIAPSTRRR